ncbi:MAG TPA: XrtA system polysaccharide chain length determinant [Nevskiaceae bacterium]
MPQQSVDVHEMFERVLLEARATWRYRWHAVVVAWVLVLAGLALVFSLPNEYQSSAQVYADTAALSNPLLHGIAVQPDVRGRLEVVTRTLLSRPNLETVADKTGLALRATTPASNDELLLKLQHAVKIKGAGARDLYDITYTDRDPQMTQKVVQAFVQVLMNDALSRDSGTSSSARQFLQRQVDDYAARLNTAEKKLADFETANAAYLPSQGGGTYFARTQAAQAALQSLQEQYNAAVVARDTAEQQMHAITAGSTSASPGGDGQLAQINEQIADYRQKLDNLLLTYTDEYPGVIAARNAIKRLEARKAALPKESGGASSQNMAPGVSGLAYQQMQQNLYEAQVQVKTLGAKVAAQKQEIAGLAASAGKITQVQAALQELTRNLGTTKQQYDTLVARLNTAQLSQDAAQSGNNNLQFRIISPPVVPILPSGPKRGRLLLVVLVIALGAGGAYAFFVHKIRPVFVNLKGLRDFTDYPVLGALTLIPSARHRVGRWREAAGFYAVMALLAAVVVASFAFSGSLSAAMQHVIGTGIS